MVEVLDQARGVLFTGGDQLKLTSQLGDTPSFQRIHDIHRHGGVIAGTSAGASIMCQTMLVSGGSGQSATVGDAVRMAAGLGFVEGLVIDQHFAERGRMGRLLGANAENPKELGLGIDENTAVVVRGPRFRVFGSGSVYVVDGQDVSWSNVAEAEVEHNLAMHDVRLHVMAAGDKFDLRERRPARRPQTAQRKKQTAAAT